MLNTRIETTKKIVTSEVDGDTRYLLITMLAHIDREQGLNADFVRILCQLRDRSPLVMDDANRLQLLIHLSGYRGKDLVEMARFSNEVYARALLDVMHANIEPVTELFVELIEPIPLGLLPQSRKKRAPWSQVEAGEQLQVSYVRMGYVAFKTSIAASPWLHLPRAFFTTQYFAIG
jgi:hypothetical protein